MENAFFPLYPIENGQCSCNREGCRDAGKHPRVKWQEPSDYVPAVGESYGIATGSRSGVFVVDVDGAEAGRHLATLGTIPPTLIVRTGREDGYHIYFKCPEDFVVRNDAGRKLGHVKIDVRGEGGFVVGPGSAHKSGNTYTVVQDCPPTDAPSWLLDRLRMDATERREASAMAPKPVDIETPEGERRVTLAIEWLATEAEPSIQGENGSAALWHVAQKLVRSFELPLDVCLECINEIYNPRCVPEWSDSEIIHKLEDARDRSSWMCGIPPEDWAERLVAARQAPTRVAPAPSTRKKHTPGHAYTFTPGDRPNGDKRKDLTFANMVADLVTHPDWEGVLQYDEFGKKFYAVDPPMRMDAEKGGITKQDGHSIAGWFEVCSMYEVTKIPLAKEAAMLAARRNSYHPVREYLDSVGKQKTGILDTLAERALGATDPMANESLKKTLVGAVKRIRQPGCQMDTMPVLVGPQGIRKTTFVRKLFGEEFVRSQMPDLANKDASAALNGFWAVELAELSRIVNAENSTVKEFLTRTADDYRPSYGETDQHYPRQCIFIGTTNDTDFLTDATGNRRYLPICCGAIDIDYIITHRDEIWAEANALEAEGYKHWYEDESLVEASRAVFIREDPWQPCIREFLVGQEKVRSADVFRIAVSENQADLLKYDRKVQMRIADTLKRLGCSQVKDSQSNRWWIVPDSLKLETPSHAEIKRRNLASGDKIRSTN